MRDTRTLLLVTFDNKQNHVPDVAADALLSRRVKFDSVNINRRVEKTLRSAVNKVRATRTMLLLTLDSVQYHAPDVVTADTTLSKTVSSVSVIVVLWTTKVLLPPINKVRATETRLPVTFDDKQNHAPDVAANTLLSKKVKLVAVNVASCTKNALLPADSRTRSKRKLLSIDLDKTKNHDPDVAADTSESEMVTLDSAIVINSTIKVLITASKEVRAIKR